MDRIVAEGDKALKQNEIASKVSIEREKISSSDRQKSEEGRIKEKEIESKERIEKLKAKTALKNKVVGEK